MSNVAIIKKYFKAVQTGDLATVGAIVAKDIVWHQPGANKFSGVHKGADAVFGVIGGMMQASGGTFKIDKVIDVMATGSDKVAATIEFSGQRDAVCMKMEGVDVFTMKNGQIQEAWLYSSDQAAEDAFWGGNDSEVRKNCNNENIELVKKYFKAVQTGDLATVGALVAKNVVWHQPGANKFSGTHRSSEAVFGVIGGMMQASDGTFKIDEVKHVMANGSDKVAAMIEFSGKRQGAAMKMRGVDVLTVQQGQIHEASLYSSDQPAEDAFWGKA